MTENDPFDSIRLGGVARGEPVGVGLLFIVTQLYNLENGEVLLEGRPLRESHQYIVQWLPNAGRSVTLDGVTVVMSQETLEVYKRNYKANQRLGHSVITAIWLLDARQYQHFLYTGQVPTVKA